MDLTEQLKKIMDLLERILVMIREVRKEQQEIRILVEKIENSTNPFKKEKLPN